MRTEEAPARDRGAEASDPQGAPGTSREDLRRGAWHVLRVFVVMRVALTVVAVLSTAVLPAFRQGEVPAIPGPVDVRPGWPAPPLPPQLGWDNVAVSWERFDALWFLRIASGGYRGRTAETVDGSAAFFPGYPLAIRGVSWAMGGHPLAAALLISNLSLIGALLFLYFLTRTELSEDHARRAVIYAAVFPTAFFFLAPYSESLFFLLAIASLWAARRRRWALAAGAGALAALTRNVGLLLSVPLAAEAWLQWREGRASRERDPDAIARLAWRLAAAGSVALGTAAYLWFWQRFGGDWLAPLHQQTQWQREATFPLVTIARATREAFRWIGIYAGGYHLMDWLIVIPGLLACGYAAVRFRATWGAYAWASLAAPLVYVFPPRPFMSVPRFLLPVFPMYWALAKWGERRGVHEAIVAVSAVMLGVMLLLFVNWYYVF
ncbi:MAG: hypothetical protein LC722_03890 [Actinobacteria bacterium]|nr:hypothetical protein [Actinomycetota bacterium]